MVTASMNIEVQKNFLKKIFYTFIPMKHLKAVPHYTLVTEDFDIDEIVKDLYEGLKTANDDISNGKRDVILEITLDQRDSLLYQLNKKVGHWLDSNLISTKIPSYNSYGDYIHISGIYLHLKVNSTKGLDPKK